MSQEVILRYGWKVRIQENFNPNMLTSSDIAKLAVFMFGLLCASCGPVPEARQTHQSLQIMNPSKKVFTADPRHVMRLPKLKNGSTPILEILTGFKGSKLYSAWYPDGSPIDINKFDFGSMASSGGESVTAKFKFENAPNELPQVIGRSGKGYSLTGWGTGRDEVELTFSNVSASQADLQLGVPYGPFQVFYDGGSASPIINLTRTNRQS